MGLVTKANKYDTIILGHINLSLPGLLIKYIYGSKKKVILFTHGIEVWRKPGLTAQLQLEDTILLPGFIYNEEVTAHYLLANVFIMPGKKEGSGIVFIGAMACGLPIIAGNRDGSMDALKNEGLGTFVDPDRTRKQSWLQLFKT